MNTRTRRSMAALVGLLVVPLVAALLVELFFDRPVVTGDVASLELRVLDLIEGGHPVGPYSRHGWQHPGPASFYVLAPLYALSGKSSESLFVTAGLSSVIWAALAAWLALRRRGESGVVPAITVALALLYGVVLSCHEPLGFTAVWNPVLPLLPFAALVLVSGEVGDGRLWFLPLAVALHALVVQSHVGYLPVATAAMVTGVGVAAVRRLARGGRSWSAIASALVVAGLVWAPVALDQLSGTHNLSDLVRHFVDGPRGRLPVANALTVGVVQLVRPLVPFVALGLDPSVAWIAGGALVLVVTLAMLAGSIVRARSSAPDALPLVCVVTLAVGFGSVLGVDGPGRWHSTLWLAVLGPISWVAVARRLPAWGSRAAAPTAFGVAVVAAGVGVWGVARGYGRFAERWRIDGEIATRMADALEPELAGERATWVLGTNVHDVWEILAGVVLELRKRGLAPRVDEKWRFLLGRGLDYGEPGEHAFLLDDGRRPEWRRLAYRSSVYLYATEKVERTGPTPRVVVASVVGATGDAGVLVDGRAPREGEAPEGDGTLRLADRRSSVTLALDTAIVEVLEVTCDGDDVYRIEGSVDGHAYEDLGVVGPAGRSGLRTSSVSLAPGVRPFLRLVPEGGDERFVLAEIRPSFGPWVMVPLWSQAARGDPRLLADGVALEDGEAWDVPEAVVFANEHASVVLRAPSAPVDGLRVAADANDSYRLEGSNDGGFFIDLAITPAVMGPGHRARSVSFDPSWAVFRISPDRGDGSYAVSEVAPLVRPGLALDMVSPLSRVHMVEGWIPDEKGVVGFAWAEFPVAVLDVPLRPSVAHRLVATVASQWERKIAVTVNGAEVGTLDVPAGMRSYGIDVPAEHVREHNRIEFRIDRGSEMPDGPAGRRVGAKFRRVELVETDGLQKP